MSIRLPEEPTGEQYEDAVASLIRALGYFVETRLVLDSEKRTVLELDVVATDTQGNSRTKTLIEAKSGGTGFADIFKVFGWRIFLDIPNGVMARYEEISDRDRKAFEEYAPNLNVYVTNFALRNTDEIEKGLPRQRDIPDKLLTLLYRVGWYAATAERLCQVAFSRIRKDDVNRGIAEKVKAYARATNHSFFEKDPLERIQKLYDAFQNEPNIAGSCITHQANLSGTDFETIRNEVFNSEKHEWIQYVMLLEHRARILIIKNSLEVLENCCLNSVDVEMKLSVLPLNFRKGLNCLGKSSNKTKIPYLLHIFIEVLGGFYLATDSNHDDIQLMSSLADIPECDVAESLQILDIYFPNSSGSSWIFSSREEMHSLKYFPAIFRGIGAFFRQKVSGKESYSDIAPSMGWLMNKYHGCGYRHLKPELGEQESKT